MIEMNSHQARVEETVAFLRQRLPRPPRVCMVLGTGLGNLAAGIDVECVLPYESIPNFPCATVDSHAGNLICGRLHGQTVAALQGRFHYYEGYSTRELTIPVRVLALLGAEILLVTNAAGGLNPSYAPGTIMVFRDHLNFINDNPLRGPNIDAWGPRFPDLSQPYDAGLIDIALAAATSLGLDNVAAGTYIAISGPSLETPAETRYLKNCGADAVGMSSVPEVIVAIHAGMRVLGLSLVSNVNDPDKFEPIRLDDIIAKTEAAAPRLQELISAILQALPSSPTGKNI